MKYYLIFLSIKENFLIQLIVKHFNPHDLSI